MTGLDIALASAGYGRRQVLSDIAVAPVPPGSLVAVIGANAAGKSTLLKALAGLIRASGRLVLHGEDLAGLAFAERVRRVAYLPQSLPQPTTLVAYEAVLSAVRATRPELSRGAAEDAVEEVFSDLGLRMLALKPLAEMSGGQRQMVGLAQIMARAPRLMLLDEPTSALDLHWQLDVLAAVRAAARDRGAIALMAMHDINLAISACDRVVVLAGGRVLADGAPADVLGPDVLRRAFGVEARLERCSRGRPFIAIDARSPGGDHAAP